MPVNQVVELVHENATNPAVGIVGVALGVSALVDHTLHEIRVIDHLVPSILGDADGCRGNGGTSTLIDAARERSEEGLIREEPVRVHVEVESGLWYSRRHYGPPASGASRPYIYIIQEVKA